MKRLALPLIGLIILVAALITLNHGINVNAGSDDSDTDQATPAASSKPSPAANSNSANSNAQFQDPGSTKPDAPAELVIGNPATARYKVTVGWVYDDKNQMDSARLVSAINVAKVWVASSHGQASLQVADLDIPTTDRSPKTHAVDTLGVAVNGKTSFKVDGQTVNLSDNPGEGSTVMPVVAGALTSITSKHS